MHESRILCIRTLGQHGGLVVVCVSVSVWLYSISSGYFPQPKNMQVTQIEDSKLFINVFDVSRVMNDRFLSRLLCL